MADEDGLNRLEGTSGGRGGLIIRKKKSDDDDKRFKHPGKSLLGLDVPNTPSRSAWEEEDTGRTSKVHTSSWDTPLSSTHSDDAGASTTRSISSIWRSERKHERRRNEKRRHREDTVRSVKEEGDMIPEFRDDFERAEWEREQQKLDREWYDNDQGYDEENNPFAQVSLFFFSKQRQKKFFISFFFFSKQRQKKFLFKKSTSFSRERCQFF
ncbi:unnamed protein product [Gongylonema pulchrum]|uniref:Uncharacterized protein n=1 Tax=Gongylonema pulchrum TaxID=637853 RepID=A0A183ESV4_9BILA|nr:unnamed protein product [Gongylonema pulchrum]